MDYQVTVAKRVQEILGEDFVLTSEMNFSYSWEHGYETVIVRRDGCGESKHIGCYHPNVVCEGGGICRYCGRTLQFD